MKDPESYDGDIAAWTEDNFELNGFRTVKHPEWQQVHYFSSTDRCYNETQCSDQIKNRDLLVIECDQVVGFLLDAWPVAVTKNYGALHTLKPSFLDNASMAERLAWSYALDLARSLGYELDPEMPTELPQ
jgi:hypothetical protein